MTRSEFGRLPDGRPVHVLVIGRPPGPVLHLLDLGATVHRLEVTGGDGQRRNVTLNHDSPAGYLGSTTYLGATVGRYANRIAGGRFTFDGRLVEVGVNDRGHHLHGGPDGFDRRLWTVAEHGPDDAVLTLVSPDGDQGFPGTLRVSARFRTGADAVRIDLEATTDRPTVVNLTNHAYFNLDGDTAGTIDEHELQLAADRYTPVDASGIPLDAAADVAGTPFDFRIPAPIGPAIRADHDQVRAARGIDHNVVLRATPGRPAAVLTSARTATRLELHTDQPGLQVYTGNFLDGRHRSASGRLLRQGDGIALEPQRFPDTPNHPEFPPARLDPGEVYRAAIEWRFSALTG
jgi:galactose mutarotase-like enzyme